MSFEKCIFPIFYSEYYASNDDYKPGSKLKIILRIKVPNQDERNQGSPDYRINKFTDQLGIRWNLAKGSRLLVHIILKNFQFFLGVASSQISETNVQRFSISNVKAGLRGRIVLILKIFPGALIKAFSKELDLFE